MTCLLQLLEVVELRGAQAGGFLVFGQHGAQALTKLLLTPSSTHSVVLGGSLYQFQSEH